MAGTSVLSGEFRWASICSLTKANIWTTLAQRGKEQAFKGRFRQKKFEGSE
uniref:Uncharacterized protein n=1 Tax=Oryza sativa subsp. japonica TaxID=39947 RepID=Q69KE5_ORYSJ|nr:unknown protein [Oryza sativa Japonica Group]BAD36595.1 unknown protein [Oryza sativa Japonica Group]